MVTNEWTREKKNVRFRDELNEFMERSGAVTPGILVMTTGLSKPFRRLDKYSAMLQELERHTEKNHPDRGDTQRSVCVYREISVRVIFSLFFVVIFSFPSSFITRYHFCHFSNWNFINFISRLTFFVCRNAARP